MSNVGVESKKIIGCWTFQIECNISNGLSFRPLPSLIFAPPPTPTPTFNLPFLLFAIKFSSSADIEVNLTEILHLDERERHTGEWTATLYIRVS